MNGLGSAGDMKRETASIIAFVRRTVRRAKANGVVIGVSGGIDSAVVGALCVRALGKDRVLVLLMPSEHTPRADVDDARALAAKWGTKMETIAIDAIVEEFKKKAKVRGSRIADANVQARVRMALLYYYANTLGLLVAGTGDRSEAEIGFFTKWGDGGADFLPLAHLYKTQVRELGARLGLPKRIVGKPASPRLWPGHRASDELPADYDKLDVVLRSLLDGRSTRREAAIRAAVPLAVVDRVMEMHRRTAHKRRLPPSLA